MAEEETITMENIKEMLDEALSPVTEALTAIDERVKALEDAEQNDEGEGDEEKKNEIEAAKAQAAEAVVDAQIMAGKVLPAQKEAMTKLAKADMESFQALMKDAQVIVPLEARKGLLTGADDDDDDDETLTPEEENLNAVLDYFAGE